MKSIFTSTRGQHLRELRLEISNKLSINYLKLLEIIIKKKQERKKEKEDTYTRISRFVFQTIWKAGCAFIKAWNEYSGLFSNREIFGGKNSDLTSEDEQWKIILHLFHRKSRKKLIGKFYHRLLKFDLKKKNGAVNDIDDIKQFIKKFDSLEEVSIVDVAEEGDGVGQHPNISTPAIVIRFRPSAILVSHCQYLVLLPFRVRRFVQRVRVKTCEKKNHPFQL